MRERRWTREKESREKEEKENVEKGREEEENGRNLWRKQKSRKED